jgi:hypothetical protein
MRLSCHASAEGARGLIAPAPQIREKNGPNLKKKLSPGHAALALNNGNVSASASELRKLSAFIF